jgi:PAS domain S-box-containing protein
LNKLGQAAKWRLTAIGVLIPLAIVAVALIWQDYQARREATLAQLELQSAQVNEQLESFVGKTEGISQQVASNFAIVFPSVQLSRRGVALDDDANAYLSNIVAQSDSYDRAIVTDRDGMVLAASDRSGIGERIPAATFFEVVAGTNSFTVSNVFTPAKASPNAMFAYPVRDELGGATAYLVLKSDLSAISSQLDMSTGFPETAKSGIFDSNGVVLAGTGYVAPHPGGAVGKNVSGSAVWAQAMTQPTEAWFGPGLDKVDRIIYFEYPENTPWITTVAYAQSELFDPLWTRVYGFSAGLAATVIGTLVLIEILRRRERGAWESLSGERQTLEAVIEGCNDGVVVSDIAGNIAYINERFKSLFGMQFSASNGQELNALMLDSDGAGRLDEQNNQILRALLHDASGSGQATLAVEGTPTQELDLVSYPIFRWDGSLAGRTILVRDVTEERKLQRMKSEFVAHASHQLRTPLASVLASSELLLIPDVDSNKREKWVGLIHSQALRMRTTINTLLNLSALESGRISLDPTTVDLVAIGDSISDESAARSDVHTLKVDVDDEARYAICDRAKIVEVLQSLLDNAIKYSPDGGDVRISTRRIEDGAIAVSVSDNGVGISEHEIGGLFNPYERASAQARGFSEGSGLGLYIVRSLIELHGGKVWAQSIQGEGSTFTFTIDADDSALDAPAPASDIGEWESNTQPDGGFLGRVAPRPISG